MLLSSAIDGFFELNMDCEHNHNFRPLSSLSAWETKSRKFEAYAFVSST